MTKVIIKERAYIPIQDVSLPLLKKTYELAAPNKLSCSPTCRLAKVRNKFCGTCPGKDARIKLWSKEVVKGRKYIAVPTGDLDKIDELKLNKVEFVDSYKPPKFRSSLEWTGKLWKGGVVGGYQRANQVRLIKRFIRHVKAGNTGGLIISPPRTGKTVLGVRVALALKTRTYITASQIDFLRQFCKRIAESSNLRQLYREGKTPVILIDPQGWVDSKQYGIKVLNKWTHEVDNADIVLSTYQQFINPERGPQKIKEFLKNFGLLIGDEIHMAAAKAFSRLMNRILVRYKLGLTATYRRPDRLEKIVEAIIGPVVVTGETITIVPKVELLETGVVSSRNYKHWSYMEKFLVENEARNRLIVKQVFKDLRANKQHNILIPVTRVSHVATLVKMINEQAAYNRAHRNEDWPKELAVPFKRGVDTNLVMKQINAGLVRVVVAISKMVKHGLDVQRWTHVYVGIVPTSNTPLMYQLGNRVCTPYDEQTTHKLGDKPTPVIRFTIDSMSASIFCFVKLFNDLEFGIKAGLMGTTIDNDGNQVKGSIRYKADEDTTSRMIEIAKFPKSYSAADAGVKKVFKLTKTGRQVKKDSWRPNLKGIIKL